MPNQQHKVPELLIPAGSLEKLKVAVQYGADAVYLGGQNFGLRTAADNFTRSELTEGVAIAHQHGVKVYVVLNSFFHDSDLDSLPEFVEYLNQLSVDAVIVSDLGGIEIVKKYSNLPIHLSTQASCLNSGAAKLWKQMGVKRLVLGREVSLAEAQRIKEHSGLEVEMFIHGSMCMAYSGNCTISNFTQGRDSNRGGCAHSCRFSYSFYDQNHRPLAKERFFMSSKDLNGLSLLPEYQRCSIDSVKIEGRMKSHLYAATMAKTYSEALSALDAGEWSSEKTHEWQSELRKITHRDYTEASLEKKADSNSIFDEREHGDDRFKMAAIVVEALEDKMILEVRHAFNLGEQLELVVATGRNTIIYVTQMKSINGENLERTKPSTLVILDNLVNAKAGQIIRYDLKQKGHHTAMEEVR